MQLRFKPKTWPTSWAAMVNRLLLEPESKVGQVSTSMGTSESFPGNRRDGCSVSRDFFRPPGEWSQPMQEKRDFTGLTLHPRARIERWTLNHPIAAVHDEWSVCPALRQPGNPRETVKCSWAHGFASPPYDGFARSRM